MGFCWREQRKVSNATLDEPSEAGLEKEKQASDGEEEGTRSVRLELRVPRERAGNNEMRGSDGGATEWSDLVGWLVGWWARDSRDDEVGRRAVTTTPVGTYMYVPRYCRS